jgi:hypothetical protein
MIGVAAADADLDVAAELFELFKTPWEPVVPGRHYDVVLSSGVEVQGLDARVVLLYGASIPEGDRAHRDISAAQVASELCWGKARLPLFGPIRTFERDPDPHLVSVNGKPAAYQTVDRGRIVWNIGYDLLLEIRHLLTAGQPAANAETPTLEWHIEILRHLLLKSGVSFVEVPPRPAGFDFTCCLTHDLDFVGIRRHGFDRTMAGFIARASVGSLVEWVRGRRPMSEVVRNWGALLSLPLVLLRVVPDFWRPFDDYEQAERTLPSTYFVIPFKNKPGVASDGPVVRSRGVAYQASEVRDDIRRAVDQGREVGVHGIDAWRLTDAGRAEIAELAAITGNSRIGVRMHWLYFDEQSPARLEDAGFDYDSTWGYNDAVGFRPGTSQVFRLACTRSLMELPLTIMDSALFYQGRMNLTRGDALRRCFGIVANVRRFGGSVVVNWHDRSLAPERLWGFSYRALLHELMDGDRAWFATAQQAVDWFRWRRSVVFKPGSGNQVRILAARRPVGLPAACVTVRRPGADGSDAIVYSFEGGRELALQV